MSIQTANAGHELLRNSHLSKGNTFSGAKRWIRGLEGDTTVSVPRTDSSTTEDDRVRDPPTDPRAALMALAGDIRQPLQVFISARDTLARRLGGGDTVELALINGAVMKLPRALNLISNILRSWEDSSRAHGEPVSLISTRVACPITPADEQGHVDTGALTTLLAQTHMWTAPSSQGVLQRFDQIACVHRSGLSVRSHMNAGQDGFRDKGSKQQCDQIEGHWVCRSVPRRGSIDHTICFLSCKFWHRLSTVAVQLLPVSGQSLDRAGRGRGFRAVRFACQHHLPGNARGLVGQRHGGQLRRLALEKCGKPGRRLTAAHSMLDHRGSADHQHAAQSLVAGARDHAEPDLARGRMIPWR